MGLFSVREWAENETCSSIRLHASWAERLIAEVVREDGLEGEHLRLFGRAQASLKEEALLAKVATLEAEKKVRQPPSIWSMLLFKIQATKSITI